MTTALPIWSTSFRPPRVVLRFTAVENPIVTQGPKKAWRHRSLPPSPNPAPHGPSEPHLWRRGQFFFRPFSFSPCMGVYRSLPPSPNPAPHGPSEPHLLRRGQSFFFDNYYAYVSILSYRLPACMFEQCTHVLGCGIIHHAISILHACMHACMYVHMYVCMHVCMYVLMYVCIDVYMY
jgi:hypothetical protein